MSIRMMPLLKKNNVTPRNKHFSQNEKCLFFYLHAPPNAKKKHLIRDASNGFRQRPILPDRLQSSTFGTEGLNFCVRNGNRWDPFVITTGNCELVDSQGA